MKLKEKILITLLLTIGLLLHYITPGIFLGMKVDFLLIFIIISIMLFPEFENYLLVALLGGLFSAMATTFPGGQISNMIDKLISTYVILLLVKALEKHLDKKIVVLALGFIGTMVSGTIFLASSKFIMGLDNIGINLIYLVVLPSAVINSIALPFTYSMVSKVKKMTGSPE